MKKDFLGMGFFGGKHFESDDRKRFFEEWDSMEDSEKLEIINKRIEDFKEGKKCREEMISVEHIDAHCKEWMDKTPEEKAKFVEDLKKSFEERHAMMKEWKQRFGHYGFGFHGRGRGCAHSGERH